MHAEAAARAAAAAFARKDHDARLAAMQQPVNF